jgi:RHS repeat-associated protein
MAFGLIDMQARMYSPLLGRFTSPDTVIDGGYGTPIGLNRYAYTRNNPLKYTDPTGHWAQVAIGVGIGIVAGGVGSYISQVGNNLSSGNMNLGDALTTNINVGKIAGSMVSGGISDGAAALCGIGCAAVGNAADEQASAWVEGYVNEAIDKKGDLSKIDTAQVVKPAEASGACTSISLACGGKLATDATIGAVSAKIASAIPGKVSPKPDYKQIVSVGGPLGLLAEAKLPLQTLEQKIGYSVFNETLNVGKEIFAIKASEVIV